MTRLTQIVQKIGWLPAILIFIPFACASPWFWYVFHHAPDSIVTPRLEPDHRLIHMRLFFAIGLMIAAAIFFLPAAAIATCRISKNTLLRFILPPLIALALLQGLFSHAAWLYAKWPPAFATQAQTTTHEH